MFKEQEEAKELTLRGCQGRDLALVHGTYLFFLSSLYVQTSPEENRVPRV